MGRPFEVDLHPASGKIALSEPGAPAGRGGRFAIAADRVEQILPKPGSYHVSAVLPDGNPVTTVVTITADRICGTLPERVRKVPEGLRFHRRLEGRMPGDAPATSLKQEK